MELAEDAAVGTTVQRVVASYADEPGTRNSRIEYMLESNEHELDMFNIHHRTGELSSSLCRVSHVSCVWVSSVPHCVL